VEDEEVLILYLHQKGLTPGTQLTFLGKKAAETVSAPEEVLLNVNGNEVTISWAAATKIWVQHQH
jgi:DtxR family Mn-dependent transcriptional regulator